MPHAYIKLISYHCLERLSGPRSFHFNHISLVTHTYSQVTAELISIELVVVMLEVHAG